MSSGSFYFGRFVLDPKNRQLTRDDVTLDLNNRYLDALTLLLSEQGQLVTKERFLEEVWKGVPVTDEVVTQCIKTLRKLLGDSASNSRYIETIPKHGYRFIAPVELRAIETRRDEGLARNGRWQQFVALGTAGTIGGGFAGLLGGLLYGFTAASQSSQAGTGAISTVLVVLSMTILIALIGGTGVGFGIATSRLFFRRSLFSSVAGGAVGGMAVGAIVKLLGIDALNLLFGQSPGDVTGAVEGLVLGGAVGLGVSLTIRDNNLYSVKRCILSAALIGAGAGTLIALLGGRLMIGSLDLLVRQFSGSRLEIDKVGQLFGETGFGEISRLATSCLEGALFAACIVGTIAIARRGRNGAGPQRPVG